VRGQHQAGQVVMTQRSSSGTVMHVSVLQPVCLRFSTLPVGSSCPCINTDHC
jgi:hypothetical protein